MSRLLFTVADRFLIRGRGVIVVPGLTVTDAEQTRIGDRVSLKRPDGTTVSGAIGGMDLAIENRKPFERAREVSILLTGLKKEDVPVGTEVWTDTADQVLP